MPISSLKNQKYFDLVNKRGTKLHKPSAVLVLAKNYPNDLDTVGHITLGMKVGKKLGNAVVRNKIKRRIRHIITLISKQADFKSNLGLIVVARKGFDKATFSTLFDEFSKSLSAK